MNHSVFPVVNCETIVVENRLNNKPTITQKIVDHKMEILIAVRRRSNFFRPITVTCNRLKTFDKPNTVKLPIDIRRVTTPIPAMLNRRNYLRHCLLER